MKTDKMKRKKMKQQLIKKYQTIEDLEYARVKKAIQEFNLNGIKQAFFNQCQAVTNNVGTGRSK